MEPFSPEIELSISPDSVRVYTELAYKHLQQQNATVDVEEAGTDDTGHSVFGICMRSNDGDEEWYDPSNVGGDANYLFLLSIPFHKTF